MNLTLQDRLNMITAKVENDRKKKLAKQETDEKQYRDMINEIVSYEPEIGEILTLAQELNKNSIQITGTYARHKGGFNFLCGKKSSSISIEPDLRNISLRMILNGRTYDFIVGPQEIHTVEYFNGRITNNEDVPYEVVKTFISCYPDFKEGFYKWFDNATKIK